MTRPPPQMVSAAIQGDVAALNALLEGTRQDLRRYAEYHCEVNDVEDAVQETLFKASRRMRDLRQVESLVSWLFRIVKRECNRMRRGWRMLTNQEIDQCLLPATPMEPMELRLDVSRALAAVPAHYRVILLLRDIEGLTLHEIAQQLNLTLPATKSRLHRARCVVREQLTGTAGAEENEDCSMG